MSSLWAMKVLLGFKVGGGRSLVLVFWRNVEMKETEYDKSLLQRVG